jgi:hypothetical protein
MSYLMSNFDNGFANGISVRGIPLVQTHSGAAFWVDSVNGSNGGKGTFQSPFASVAYAVTRCTASIGDVIFCKASHAETISAASGIAMSVAGVAVVGLGLGTSRPTFTFDTANTAAITVSAANVSFQNCVFTANFLSIAAAFVLTTAKNFTIENCTFQDTSNVLNFLNCIKSTGAANTADGLSVINSRWRGTGTTSVNSMVLIADANINVTLLRNRCYLERVADASILITVTTGASTGIEMGDNIVISKQTATTNGTMASLGASSTGVAYRNFSGTLVTAGDKLFTTTVGIFPYENRVSGVVGATGFVIPAVDT